MKVQTKVPTELLKGNKPVWPRGVQKSSGNECISKMLEDVYYEDEIVNKKPEEDLRLRKLGIQHRRQANQIPRMTVKGNLRILTVKWAKEKLGPD